MIEVSRASMEASIRYARAYLACLLFCTGCNAVFTGAQTQGQANAIVQPRTDFEIVTLHAKDGTKITALYGQGDTTTDVSKPTLVFFYGNGSCAAYCLEIFAHFRQLGFNIIMPDYEGYGMSGGSASEHGCYATADAAYDYLLTRTDVDRRKIVSVGWSLGSAVAIDLASRRPVEGLATFSAFTSINDMARALAIGLPLGSLVPCRFDNLAKMPSVSCPIFMVHGTHDPLVPPAMMDRLARAAKTSVTTMPVAGAGHNDLFQIGGDALYHRLAVFVDGLSDGDATTRSSRVTAEVSSGIF